MSSIERPSRRRKSKKLRGSQETPSMEPQGTSNQPLSSVVLTPDQEAEHDEHEAHPPGVTRRYSEDWVLDRPHDGGPRIPDILYAFRGHIAYALWRGKDREVLQCHGRQVSHLIPPTAEADRIMQGFGFCHLRDCVWNHFNAPLISAFIERWHPETNSFHLPFGEMSITLHDVHYILGIPVSGHPLVWSDDLDSSYTGLLARFIGQSITDVHDVMGDIPGTLPFQWLFDSVNSLDLADDRLAKGFLLLLLSGSLFVDKSKSRVLVRFSHFIEDLESVREYAWGAATLAWLYRQLGVASRADCKQIGGCLTLLEAWIYAYFPMFRPPTDPIGDGVYASRWRPSRVMPRYHDSILRSTRDRLDRLTAEEVVWTPFGSDPARVVPITLFHGIIHCLSITEPYMPDRVLRQFGYVQCIPGSIISPLVECRPTQVRKYVLTHDRQLAHWDRWRHHCVPLHQAPYRRVSWAAETESSYLDWYRERTHLYITRHRVVPSTAPIPVPNLTPEARLRRLAEVAYWLHPSRRGGDLNEYRVEVDEIAQGLEDLMPVNPPRRSSRASTS